MSFRKFIISRQNSGWKYWSHFQTIQPLARAKGQRALQPSHHAVATGGDGAPSTQAPVLPTSTPIDPSPTNDTASAGPPARLDKRPSDLISLDDSSNSSGADDPAAPSTTMVGSAVSPKLKAAVLGPPPSKALKTTTSSTARTSSAASGSTRPPSSAAVSQSFQSSGSGAMSRNVKTQTIKGLGDALQSMKDSLNAAPEDPVSRLRREATAFVMKDARLSYAKRMHIAVLIQDDIKFAETLQGMIEADVDNDGVATGAVVRYYTYLTKDIPDTADDE